MNSKEQIELTIRVANIGKAVMDLVGVKSFPLARMHFSGIADAMVELAKFIDYGNKVPVEDKESP